jgi:hypothetical protein
MALIHFEFDVDSDVHPELHATLAAIASSASRGERLRQLAATGLIWEAVRGHADPKASAPERRPSAPAKVDAAPQMRPADAPPALPASPPGDPANAPHYPVLVDVGALTAPPHPIDLLAARHLEPSAADENRPAESAPLEGAVASPFDDPVADTDDVALVADETPVSPVQQSPSTRSRLLRMKEKGLFKNG